MKRAKALPSICLYGTRETGAGWLASNGLPMADGGRLFGDGEPSRSRTFTYAIFEAARALREAGLSGKAHLFDAGGLRVAEISLSLPPTYGLIAWAPAPMYVVDADEVVRAAKKGE